MNKRHTHFLSARGASALTAATLVLLALGSPRARADYDETTTKSFDVKAGGKLVILADRGSIQVAPGQSDKVEVRIVRKVEKAKEKEAKDLLAKHELSFKQDGREVVVQAKADKGISTWGMNSPRLQVSYYITVPSQFDLDLKTSAGSVHVGDQQGQVSLQTAGGSLHTGAIQGDLTGKTSAGSIHVGSVSGRTDVQTAGGSIEIKAATKDVLAVTSAGSISVEKADGKVYARTSGGGIRLGDIAGSIKADTAAGSIAIRHAKSDVRARTAGGGIEVESAEGAVEASTSAGGIQVGFAKSPSNDCKLETAGGAIVVRVPEGFSADLDAAVVGGKVHSDLPVQASTGEPQRGKLAGKLGTGGKQLRLRTSAGSIQLVKSQT